MRLCSIVFAAFCLLVASCISLPYKDESLKMPTPLCCYQPLTYRKNMKLNFLQTLKAVWVRKTQGEYVTLITAVYSRGGIGFVNKPLY